MATFFPAGTGTYTLQSSISSTQTTITLTSFKVPVSGDNLTMALMNTSIAYGTISPRTTQSEFISFTGITQNGDGTATLTGVTRGLNKTYPYTEDSDFKLPHAGATQFILSDMPQVFDKYVSVENTQTISGAKTFSVQNAQTSAGNPVTDNEYARKAYVDAVATGGVSNNRTIVAGTAGETIAIDQLIYLKVSDGRWWLADADTAATVDNVILGIAQGAGTAGNPITSGVLTNGLHTFTSLTLTANTQYYASNTAGGFSSTPGTTEVSLGESQTTTTFLFYPRFDQQLTENQQDALAGTSGTPSNTNRYVTNDDTATAATADKVVRALPSGLIAASFLSGSIKFGGNGSDGALSVSSGNTNIDLGGAQFVVKNYTSISITGTGSVTFINPHPSGSIIYVKSQGDVTLTSSATPMLDASGCGTAGGARAVNAATATAGTDMSASVAFYSTVTNSGGRPATGASSGAPSTAITNPSFYGASLRAITLNNERLPVLLLPGCGGGGGSSNNNPSAPGVAGNGGNGGGALYMECAGAWNFTTANGISVAGKNGENASGTTNSAGGGGGGAPGMFLALYNTLTANTGTVNVSLGTGGTGLTLIGTPYAGGGGSSAGNAGGSSAGAGAGGVGGAAITNAALILQNNSI